MQAYALAVRELLPSLANAKIRVTLHFLEPNVEVHLADELLERARCEQAIDEGMHAHDLLLRPGKLSRQNRASLPHAATSSGSALPVKNGSAKTGPQMSRQEQTAGAG